MKKDVGLIDSKCDVKQVHSPEVTTVVRRWWTAGCRTERRNAAVELVQPLKKASTDVVVVPL